MKVVRVRRPRRSADVKERPRNSLLTVTALFAEHRPEEGGSTDRAVREHHRRR